MNNKIEQLRNEQRRTFLDSIPQREIRQLLPFVISGHTPDQIPADYLTKLLKSSGDLAWLYITHYGFTTNDPFQMEAFHRVIALSLTTTGGLLTEANLLNNTHHFYNIEPPFTPDVSSFLEGIRWRLENSSPEQLIQLLEKAYQEMSPLIAIEAEWAMILNPQLPYLVRKALLQNLDRHSRIGVDLAHNPRFAPGQATFWATMNRTWARPNEQVSWEKAEESAVYTFAEEDVPEMPIPIRRKSRSNAVGRRIHVVEPEPLPEKSPQFIAITKELGGRDPFEVTGISYGEWIRSTKQGQDQLITQATRRIARKYHPDINPTPGSLEKFKNAYKAINYLRQQIALNQAS